MYHIHRHSALTGYTASQKSCTCSPNEPYEKLTVSIHRPISVCGMSPCGTSSQRAGTVFLPQSDLPCIVKYIPKPYRVKDDFCMGLGICTTGGRVRIPGMVRIPQAPEYQYQRDGVPLQGSSYSLITKSHMHMHTHRH